jgi:hypothetical protein
MSEEYLKQSSQLGNLDRYVNANVIFSLVWNEWLHQL